MNERDLAGVYHELKRLEYQDDFNLFFRDAWHTVEPGVDLKWGWAMEAIGTHIQALMMGTLGKNNLLINCPPGISKSMFASVMLPAWVWTWNPSQRIIGASYATSLSMRDAVRSRQVIGSEWYQSYWGDKVQMVPGKDAQQYYENKSTGWRYATSSTAALTGFRGDLIIIDDPHSVASAESEAERGSQNRWFSETVPTRVNDPFTAKKICIMQRVNAMDISGFILEHLSDEWEHLMLPMEFEEDRRCKTSIGFVDPRKYDGELLFPERFPAEYVESLKKQFRAESGEYAIAGQLQQRPVGREGGMFKVNDVKYIAEEDERLNELTHVVRGWDFAASEGTRADYTVGLKLGKMRHGGYVVLEVLRVKKGPGEVEQLLLNTAVRDGLTVIQGLPKDPGAAGKSVNDSRMQLLDGYAVRSSPESGSKFVRATPVAAQCEQGRLYVLAGQSWTDEFVRELTQFSPSCRHDDQVDALSRAFMEMTRLTGPGISTVAPRYFEDKTKGTF